MNRNGFNKENVTELFSQIVKILERDGNTPEIARIVQDLRKLSNSVLIELKKSKSARSDVVKSIIKKRLSSKKYTV
jgi:hypothetical protein